jgi:hypothetical protein
MIQLNALAGFKTQPELCRVRSRVQDEREFQMLAIFLIGNVNIEINFGVFHAL